MSFTINDKLYWLLSISKFLLKDLSKFNFKYLSQEFDNNILDLVKQKGFYPYKCISDFEKVKEELPGKEKFYGSLTDRNIRDKEYQHVLNV